MRYKHVILILSLLALSGCASTDTTSSDDMQGPPGMSGGKGMGRGGGGGQHGPPDRSSNEKETEKPLPEEAFTACKEKNVGDTVLLTLPNGEHIKATCTLVDDHMVAMPEKQKKPGRR